MLYYVLSDSMALAYPVALGKEGFDWQGEETVSAVKRWPSWRPPAEMRQRDPTLPAFVPGGPSNPLGVAAIYLGDTLYRIHGTNEPRSIGKRVSSGCIRMHNDHVLDLIQRIDIGTKVVVE
jgi:lipoprotein-anchoring transpeptidase ErfK/SrfK